MTDQTRRMLQRLLIAVVFSIAFAYIEAAVVVYLRAIFHEGGFTFPLQVFDATAQGKRLLLTEVGREAATLVLIFTAAWLFGSILQERLAYFLLIFAVWDIFYYVWLKVLLDWPATFMDWDVLFLIPMIWASPVLYPVLVSIAMFAFATAILYRCAHGRPLTVTRLDWLGWSASLLVIVVSFCLGGTHVTEPNYAEYFYWPLFAVGFALGIAFCVKSLLAPARAFRRQDVDRTTSV
ncbi:MAG: hypothetical protein FJ280_02410 [Planctomycetes bacterium]|nr:hypothetical protein [Planctomycetota bacterium]